MVVTTYSYATKDGRDLLLDVYVDSLAASRGNHAALIFSYGGSWENGKRQDGKVLLQDLAKAGYVAVGIDYRLGIRQLKEQGVKIGRDNFGQSYANAIAMAIEDLFDATRFIIDHAQTWEVDTSKVVVSGSSAGAINSLTAEYLVSVGHPLAKSRLPESFNYAAVVSFAGGVWVAGTDTLTWQREPCPVIAYHGTKDQLVPYGKLVMPGGSFAAFGPDYYIRQLREMNVSTLMHRYIGVNHDIAGIYMNHRARAEMIHTLTDLLAAKETILIDTTEEYPDRQPERKSIENTLDEMGIKQ